MGGAIYASEVKRRLPKIPGYNPTAGYQDTSNLAGLVHIQVRQFRRKSSGVDLRTLIIQPVDLREQVLHAYTGSVSAIWSVQFRYFGRLYYYWTTRSQDCIYTYRLRRFGVQWVYGVMLANLTSWRAFIEVYWFVPTQCIARSFRRQQRSREQWLPT